MAYYGDVKHKKSRKRSWTKADNAAYDADMRRQRKRQAAALADRNSMLNRMTKEERDAFLADKIAEKLRKQKEAEKRDKEYRARLIEGKESLVDESRLISGFLHTEIASAIKHRDKHDLYDGDWLDDPVSAITTGRGFSEEILESVGIKMQVNVCLDCSNSMLNNGLAEVATACMRTIYLALVKASDGLPPGSLVVNSWLWALGDNGKVVEHLERMHYAKFTDDNPLGPMAALPVGKYGSSFWSGEDTWLYPLLEKICTWEENYGDARAYRLDLIITDGVLEHKTDPGKCDKIQDTRDGVLQTIVLNFLPPENWADTRVPIRCIQYSVDVDNIFAVLRSVLGDWLVEMM